MTDEPQTPDGGHGSDVEPLPAPREGQTLQEGDQPIKLPQPRSGQELDKADHSESESK